MDGMSGLFEVLKASGRASVRTTREERAAAPFAPLTPGAVLSMIDSYLVWSAGRNERQYAFWLGVEAVDG
jgi:hypothetical protein